MISTIFLTAFAELIINHSLEQMVGSRWGSVEEGITELARRFGSTNNLLQSEDDTLHHVLGEPLATWITNNRSRIAFTEYPDIGNPIELPKLLDVVGGLRYLNHEQILALHLNSRLKVIAVQFLGKGSHNSTVFHLHQLVSSACDYGSAGIILVHNHPSGTTKISKEDWQVTHYAYNALRGVAKLHDHVIIAHDTLVSLAEEEKRWHVIESTANSIDSAWKNIEPRFV